jgi:hypothetical protein
LLNAFLDAGNDFNVEVLLATRDDDPTDEMILITIGETTAALTREQLRCFADMLLAAPGDCGVAHDFHQFGRLLAQGVAELPHTARTVH